MKGVDIIANRGLGIRNMTAEKHFSAVGRVLYSQMLMTVAVTLVFFVIGGWPYAVSPFIGCGVALLPNLFFAYKIYLARNLQAQGIVNAFYIGETVKLILTAALFSIALQFPSVNFLFLLVGYAAVLSVFWFALWFWRD